MKRPFKKLSMRQSIVLPFLIGISIILLLTTLYHVHLTGKQNHQVARQVIKSYTGQSFSFVLSGQGDIRALNGAPPLGSSTLGQAIIEHADIDVESRLQQGQRFKFKTIPSGDQEFIVSMTPISGNGDYMGIAQPADVLAGMDSFHAAPIWLSSLAALLALGLLIWMVSGNVTKTWGRFRHVLGHMANGRFDPSMKMPSFSGNMWAGMASSVNKLIDQYVQNVSFATEVAKGNTEVVMEQEDDQDPLSNALLHVRDSLKKAKQEASEREMAEEKRRWANEGIAKFADLLRRNYDEMEDLSYSIISNLVQYLEANQGGVFLLNDNDPQDKFFELKAAYAFDRKKYMDKTVRFGEGLVGTCALERKYVYMTDLPQDYINITSGLGDANPSSLLIVPLKTDEQVVGVLEIASFSEMEQYQIEFVERVAESIASTISSLKINIQTNQLLQKSQQQAEEMSAQEEEMRQNMEEMQATQEELSRKMKDNEQMHQELSREKALLDAVMNNLPDYIYFKDKESKFIRVSQSMLPLFPYDKLEDMIGKSDFDFHQKDAAQEMFNEELEIMRQEKGFQDKVQHEVTETGKDQWVSVTKLPLYDQDGNLMGTFGISKDITRFKELEMEARKKAGNK